MGITLSAEEKIEYQKIKTTDAPEGKYVCDISWLDGDKQEIKVEPSMIMLDTNIFQGGPYIYPVIHYTNDIEEAINAIVMIQEPIFSKIQVPEGFHLIKGDFHRMTKFPGAYLAVRRGEDKPIKDIAFKRFEDKYEEK